uniref:Uncharacterized protein n=1 Tax=Populus trichocarpa TaxID=3694 RepID=A0A2K1ZS62_POPTR
MQLQIIHLYLSHFYPNSQAGGLHSSVFQCYSVLCRRWTHPCLLFLNKMNFQILYQEQQAFCQKILRDKSMNAVSHHDDVHHQQLNSESWLEMVQPEVYSL